MAGESAHTSHSTRIPEVDGLRGVAALLVLFSHTPIESSFVSDATASWLFSINYTFGVFGVDIFFVISGYVVMRVILKNYESPGFLKWFWTRRCLRIMPLAIMGILMASLISVSLGYHVSIAEIIRYLFFLGNYNRIIESVDPFAGSENLGLNHYWSLAIEEQFYIIWPLAVILLGKRPRLIVVVLIMAAGSIALRYAVARYWTTGSVYEVGYYATLSRMDGLALGILGAITSQRLSPRALSILGLLALSIAALFSITYITHVAPAMVGPETPYIQAFAVSVGLLGLLRGVHASWPTGWNVGLITHPLYQSCRKLDALLVLFGLPLFAVTIFYLSPTYVSGLIVTGHPVTHGAAALAALGLILLMAGQHSVWNRLFGSAAFIYIGTVSYGIYVYHEIIYVFFQDFVALIPSTNRPWDVWLLLIRLGLVVVCVVVSWHFFEKPILGLKDRFALVSAPRHDWPQWARLLPVILSAAVVLVVLPVTIVPSMRSPQELSTPKIVSVIPISVRDTGRYTRNTDPTYYDPKQLFDGNMSTCWHSPPPNNRTLHTISFQFAEPVSISAIGLPTAAITGTTPNDISLRTDDSPTACARLSNLRVAAPGDRIFPTKPCAGTPTRTIHLDFNNTVNQYVLICEVQFFVASSVTAGSQE